MFRNLRKIEIYFWAPSPKRGDFKISKCCDANPKYGHDRYESTYVRNDVENYYENQSQKNEKFRWWNGWWNLKGISEFADRFGGDHEIWWLGIAEKFWEFGVWAWGKKCENQWGRVYGFD